MGKNKNAGCKATLVKTRYVPGLSEQSPWFVVTSPEILPSGIYIHLGPRGRNSEQWRCGLKCLTYESAMTHTLQLKHLRVSSSHQQSVWRTMKEDLCQHVKKYSRQMIRKVLEPAGPWNLVNYHGRKPLRKNGWFFFNFIYSSSECFKMLN